jgi:hypothetical protein
MDVSDTEWNRHSPDITSTQSHIFTRTPLVSDCRTAAAATTRWQRHVQECCQKTLQKRTENRSSLAPHVLWHSVNFLPPSCSSLLLISAKIICQKMSVTCSLQLPLQPNICAVHHTPADAAYLTRTVISNHSVVSSHITAHTTKSCLAPCLSCSTCLQH